MNADPEMSGSEVGERSAYAVKLPTFEGPLDLLLHLIRQNEVEITEIPIARIADQYLATLDVMRELNLEVAGEYLLMAATLAWIKSRMLLPPTDGEADEEEGDPRAELIARLLEYRRFREVSEQLGERPLLDRDVFRPSPLALEPIPEAERELEVSLVALVDAFRRLLQRAPEGPGIHEVPAEPVSVHACMAGVMDVLESVPSIEFDRLFEDHGVLPSRARVIATFLGILELVRVAAIRVYQGLDGRGSPHGPIRLRRTTEDAQAWREKVSEWM